MKKNVIKLNENTLRQIVAESVKNVLSESYGSGYFNFNERTPNGNGQVRRSINPNLVPQNHTGADNMVGNNARKRDYMLAMHKCPTCGNNIQDSQTGYNQPFCPYCGEDLRTSSELMLGRKRGWTNEGVLGPDKIDIKPVKDELLGVIEESNRLLDYLRSRFGLFDADAKIQDLLTKLRVTLQTTIIELKKYVNE